MTYKLLSNPASNPKVAKNIGFGVLTAPLHLAPFDLSGFQVCPMASKGCAAACLHTAGNPVFMEAKNKSRIRKTRMYFKEREEFMDLLVQDIQKLVRKAEKEGLKTGVRLNATSDIPWESVKFSFKDRHYKNIMEMFPAVQFYDYTKRHNRKNLPENYHLTYSLAEDNDSRAIEALKNGINTAVVFRKDKPETFKIGDLMRPVIDGDEHDFRPADGKHKIGVIIGLKAKGLAKTDTSGFVREG